jgi:sugar lactone lactonase YvrE
MTNTKFWIAALAMVSSGAIAETKTGVAITKLEVKDGAFMTPESVLYDPATDTFLVSNINGTPFATDNNGFISRVTPDGKVKDLKWIEGGKKDVKLDAPKGMAISGGVLWVADISVVRKFDAKTGKAMGEVKIDGATFLNDVAAGKNGGVYVTDTSLTPKFESSGNDGIYSIAKDGKVTTLAKSKELGGPNGIVESGGKVYVVTFGTGSIYEVPAKGDPKQEKLPKGKLDGIVALGGGEFLVSSWEGKTVYQGKLGGPWTDLKLDIESPADIGYDTKRKQIVVPSFQGNKVMFVTVKK